MQRIWLRHQMETFSALLTGLLWGEFTGQYVSFICTWTNGRVSNRHAGDLRRHRGHYDVTVMIPEMGQYILFFVLQAFTIPSIYNISDKACWEIKLNWNELNWTTREKLRSGPDVTKDHVITSVHCTFRVFVLKRLTIWNWFIQENLHNTLIKKLTHCCAADLIIMFKSSRDNVYYSSSRKDSQYPLYEIEWNEACLTHWGRLTHICVTKLTNIGSDCRLVGAKPLSKSMLEYS